MRRRAINFAAAYGSALLSLAITVCLVRLMPESDFALVALGLAVGTFASLAVDLGAARTFTRDYMLLADHNSQCNLVHANLARRSTVLLSLLAGGVVAATFVDEAPSRRLALLLFTAWATLRGMLPVAWYDTIGKTTLQNLLNFTERVATVAAIGLVAWLRPQPAPLLLGMALVGARLVGVAAQYAIWWRVNPAKHRFDWRRLSLFGAAGTNLRVTAAFSANAIASYGSQIILRMHGSDYELAAYAVAFQLMSMVLLFQSQCLRLLMVSIAKACRSAAELTQSVVRNVAIIGCASAGLATLAAISLHILPLLLQREGYAMLPTFALPLCIWVIVVGIGQVITQHVLSMHQERHYLKVALCGGGLATVLAMSLVPRYGAIAAAYSLLAVNSFTVLANAAKLVQLIRMGAADRAEENDQRQPPVAA